MDARVEHASFDDDEHERSTADGRDDPSTLDLGGLTLPRENGAPKSAPNSRRGRANAIAISFDDETQARPVDDGVLEKLRQAQALVHAPVHAPVAAKVPADLGIEYEALPSLEVRRPYDTFEAEFAERDPVTQLHHPHESAKVRRSDQPPARDASYSDPSYPIPIDSAPAPANESSDPGWGRREESGPRERPLPDPRRDARAYAAPAPSYDDVSDSARWARDNGAQPPSGWSSVPDAIEAQPHFPETESHHPAFVHGVQPIRPPTPDAWGTPHVRHTPVPQAPMHAPPMHAMHSSMPPAYAQQAHYGQQAQHPHPHAMHAPQPMHAAQPTSYAPPPQQAYSQPPPGAAYHGASGYPAPMHAGASGQMPASQSMMNRAQPIGAQLGADPGTSKVGRFAWFVAGAAFGITFAFFATGFFSGKAQSDFPAAPPLPAVVATAPAATAPAATAPVATAPVATAPVATAPPAVTAPIAAAPAVATAPAAAVPPVAPAMMAAPAAVPAAFAAPAPPALVAAAPVAPAARPAAPPARAPRFQPPAPRRPAPPSAPVSQAPKNLGGGGAGADDEPRSPAPSAPSGGGDIGDLLGAGLKP